MLVPASDRRKSMVSPNKYEFSCHIEQTWHLDFPFPP